MFAFDKLIPSIPFILSGAWVTIYYTLLSLVLGTVLACVLAVIRVSENPLLKIPSAIYVSIFRGTPLLVQLSLAYYAIPQLTGYKISAFEAVLISFSLNSAAYVSEIIRAGIKSIDRGQNEAGLSLGVKRHMIMIDIILPQAIKNILPALVNEFISLLKESVIISIIGEMDLMRRANLVAAEKYIYFEPLLFIAVVFYLMVLVLSSFAKLIEKRLQRSD